MIWKFNRNTVFPSDWNNDCTTLLTLPTIKTGLDWPKLILIYFFSWNIFQDVEMSFSRYSELSKQLSSLTWHTTRRLADSWLLTHRLADSWLVTRRLADSWLVSHRLTESQLTTTKLKDLQLRTRKLKIFHEKKQVLIILNLP